MRTKRIISIVLAMVLLASAVPLAITPAAADLYYEIPMDADENDELTNDELVNAILPYMLDEGDFTLDDVGDAAWVYAYWNGVPKTVMEANDREVAFYRPVERVVTTFAMNTRAVVMVGGCDKLVGISYGCLWPEEEHACGGIMNIEEVAGWGRDPERILSLRPDVVFGYTRGEKPESYQEKVQALMVYAGAEYAKIKGTMHEEESMCLELEFAGEVLDTQEKAEEVVSLVHEKCGLVKDVVSQIPEDERPKACLVSGKGMVSSAKADFCSPFYEAGAITPESDLGAKEISVEQLIDWNPDFLFITNSGSRAGKKSPLSLTVEQVLEDPRLQTINAVKNGSVYYTTGCCNWRPHQRVITSLLYMAKIFYPDELRDLDLEKEGNELFEAFYGDSGLYTEFADDLGYLREFIEGSKE